MDFTTTSDMGGDKFVPSDNEGLLVLTIGATEDTFDGQWGEVEISVVDLLVVLDHGDGPQVYTNAWVFGAALAPTLNRTNGDPFLGRLEKQKSKNGRDVWTFASADDVDKAAANKWVGQFLEKKGNRWVYVGNDQDPNEAPF